MAEQERNMRRAFGEALTEIAKEDSDAWFVDADSASSTGAASFRELFPERYCNVGVAEQELVMVATGLAQTGRRVFASCLSSFLVGRAYDQIRNLVCLSQLPVTLVGSHGGISVGPDGATHQMVEDISLMRSLPNMAVLVPSDYWSTRHLVRSSWERKAPSYIRLSRCDVPDIYTETDSDIIPGSGRMLAEGEGVTICACGIMVKEAVKAASILYQQDIAAEVIDCYSVNPLPVQVILASARRTGCCVVAEEHSSRGGLGEAVASLICSNYPIPVKFVSLENEFGQSGTPEELMEYYGLTANQIVSSVMQAWTMRRR